MDKPFRAPRSDAERKAEQNRRDRKALDSWVREGCPTPELPRVNWLDMMRWIRDRYPDKSEY